MSQNIEQLVEALRERFDSDQSGYVGKSEYGDYWTVEGDLQSIIDVVTAATR
ncbi:hypothetical protein [Subtercola sp. YIM 133946]|uniref:hypothetical protein n=1 Tax=Subtercola sp. YIM 133946 TaxID=3118909 RepID=UPI002F9420B0